MVRSFIYGKWEEALFIGDRKNFSFEKCEEVYSCGIERSFSLGMTRSFNFDRWEEDRYSKKKFFVSMRKFLRLKNDKKVVL